MSTLTPEEKVKIRHHLGYLNVASAQTFVFGIPAAVQTQFSVEGAMNFVLLEAEPELRRHLRILDGLEEQDLNDTELLAVLEVGEIKINPDELRKLFTQQYRKWRASLANLLGITPNPYDQRFAGMGVNVPVSG